MIDLDGIYDLGSPASGYVWHLDYVLRFDPDMRLQETIRLRFSRFRELGSAR